jgi:tRNA-splicing ligase RtcB
LGSLGGGNHFIELASDESGKIWLLVHSGSRYLGGLLSERYREKALRLDSEEAECFMSDQRIVIDFAAASRREMARRVIECVSEATGIEAAPEMPYIDLAHNYIELKHLEGELHAIHRKGACSAAEGDYGVIPGSMGSSTYITVGRGSEASYCSSSHGAGRALSRGEAFRRLSTPNLMRSMDGIVWSESARLKDEAPDAYKCIDAVMSAQSDLVRVRRRLTPLLSVKGDS